jgi:membrane associated rhomboid family serine protease
MLDLNHIFLFIAVVSPLLVLARAWRPGGAYRGWRSAALIVLAMTGAAWFFFREQAGYIGGGAWFAFLFLPAIALRKVTELAARQRYKAARRLATAVQVLHPSAGLREQVALFRALESRRNDGALDSWIQSAPAREDGPALRATGNRLDQSAGRVRSAPAVLVFIVLNVGAFLFEISSGDWTNPETLHRLGALEPYAVVMQGEYWRLFTALFLHGGSVHLLFNLFALYVLGPPLERAIGPVRFTICYLISGLGSSAGVVLLTVFGLVHVAQLVGASGCVMGIVGAWAGFLLRHRHAPSAKQRLANITMIVVIQLVFDLSTPQVSMAAHLCGLITGFVVGLVLAPRKMSI